MGLSAEAFWAATPRELEWEARAYQDRDHQEVSRLVYLGWLTARLSRAKTIPPLARLLPKKQAGKQTWRDMKAAMRGLSG